MLQLQDNPEILSSACLAVHWLACIVFINPFFKPVYIYHLASPIRLFAACLASRSMGINHALVRRDAILSAKLLHSSEHTQQFEAIHSSPYIVIHTDCPTLRRHSAKSSLFQSSYVSSCHVHRTIESERASIISSCLHISFCIHWVVNGHPRSYICQLSTYTWDTRGVNLASPRLAIIASHSRWGCACIFGQLPFQVCRRETVCAEAFAEPSLRDECQSIGDENAKFLDHGPVLMSVPHALHRSEIQWRL